jgi:DNA invertase Pin-like site-specific DNA recombinase
MAKIGYIMTAPGYTDYESDAKWMEEFGCIEIVREELGPNNKSRILWDSLIGRLQVGDTVVIPKLSNVLTGTRPLIFFLELCRMSNIRLISIHDQIDTGNQLFPETKTSDVLAVIAMLPKEVMAIRKAALHAQRIKRHMSTISTKSVAKTERNKRIINMYLQGVSLDDIFAMSGFTSRSSVFRILNDAKIELTRGRTRGPIGPRKKKEDREADNENEKEGDAE